MPIRKPYDPAKNTNGGGGGSGTGPTGPTGPAGGSGGVAASVVNSFTYAGGISVGDAVYINGSGFVVRASASAEATARTVGFVTAVDLPAVGQAKIQVAGESSIFSGLTAGKRYILSKTAGAILEEDDIGNAAYPDSNGEVLQIVGIATSSSDLLIQTVLLTMEICN
jgi:hypothetical protein